MPKLPPPMRPLAVSLTVDRLKIVLPAAVVALIVLALVPSLAMVLVQRTQPPVLEERAPTVSTTPAVLPLMSFTFGAVPKPGPNQKRAGACDADAAQVEINGGCWMKTDKPPPCPRGKLWEHEGKCWVPVAEAKPVPTSGEMQHAGVADP